MELKQHMGLHQQLVMTPRLQMALKILQVSTLELEQFLKQELLQNPLLERTEEEEAEAETSEETAESSESTEGEHSAEAESAPEPPAEQEREQEKAADEEIKDDALDWDDYLDDIYAHAYGQNLERDEDDERFERVPVAVATFEDGLKSQLHMECSNESLIGIAEYIIDELDGDGFVQR
jgi:RNA polymerase sigma-54 factor